MKLTNEEQTKRSLIRTQRRLLDLEARVERLEIAVAKASAKRIAKEHDDERNGDGA